MNRRTHAAVLVLAGSVLVLVAGLGSRPAAGAPQGLGEVGPRTYRPPTTAAVADPFRPPPSPYAAGNRGIEYATRPGEGVGAIGPGVVRFTGQVGGRLVVTVAHPDGLRSSYVGLGRIVVRVDDVVHGGASIGTAAGPMHLGVRRGRTYLDPASLWGRRVAGGRAVLVPEGAGPGPPASASTAGPSPPLTASPPSVRRERGPHRPWWR